MEIVVGMICWLTFADDVRSVTEQKLKYVNNSIKDRDHCEYHKRGSHILTQIF